MKKVGIIFMVLVIAIFLANGPALAAQSLQTSNLTLEEGMIGYAVLRLVNAQNGLRKQGLTGAPVDLALGELVEKLREVKTLEGFMEIYSSFKKKWGFQLYLPP